MEGFITAFSGTTLTLNVTYVSGVAAFSNWTITASGVVGTSGYSGVSGVSGSNGISGYSGSGVSGFSGYSGANVSGYSGFSGYSGATVSGYSGFSGISGYSGTAVSGYSGFSGSGVSGFSGYSGISGYSGAALNATYNRTTITASASQTTFTVSYTVGYVAVYLNGVLLSGADYTATNGTSVVLATAANSGDIFEAIAFYTVNTGIAGNISGGAASQVVYQTGANTTGFIANGTSGQVLTSAGSSVPTWSNPLSVSTANTWTATQTFNGTSSTLAEVLLNAAETVYVVAAAPSATQNFYLNNGAVQYYTTNAANNWITSLVFSSGTTMAAALAVGQSVTMALLTTQGATAYYNTAVYIDGTATGVTTIWQGGAPTKGNASGVDVYTYTIIKTAATPTYTVLASQTQFK